MITETIAKINVRNLSEADYQLAWKYPAATSRGRFYLIQGNKVIGEMRMVSALGFANGTYSHVAVEPNDDATREFFKDDFTIPTFGMVLGLRYDGITGCPIKNFDDEPDDRHKGTVIVDTTEFDFGIAHPRFSVVEGWNNIHTKRKTSVHVPQKNRRRRSSNKIKKVS